MERQRLTKKVVDAIAPTELDLIICHRSRRCSEFAFDLAGRRRLLPNTA